MTQRTVLVTGATGNQGGAVARALLNRHMKVRAFVRDPAKPKAQALAKLGAELIRGDLGDADSLLEAVRGVDSVFVLTTPYAPGASIDSEVRLGRQIIDVLKQTQVSHVVYSSVSDADRHTGIPHFESKADAEGYLAGAGLPVTVTAPVYFSNNVLFPSNLATMKQGLFRQALPSERKLQLVSLGEIGRFNAEVLARGPALAGRRINYAGDELSPAQMSAALARASGREMSFESQPVAELRAFSEDFALMYEWFDRVGYSADIPALRREFPEVGWTRFEAWAGEQDWNQLLA